MPPDYVLFIIIIIIIIYWLSMHDELWLLMTQPKSPGRTNVIITLGGLMTMNNKNIVDATDMVEAARLKQETCGRQ